MIKKFLLASVLLSQLTISCSSDDSSETIVDENLSLSEQIAEIVKQPYSSLTPEQQKVKLEAEANAMLVELDKSKTSSAIEAMENLERLLDISSVDIFVGKNDNQVEDIINVSGVYGIYTWNNTKKSWTKTTSNSDLKFVFPATASKTENNATLSVKSTSSDVKVEIIDTYGDWSYNYETNQETSTPDINDFIFLPTTADAILTIDSKEAAKFSQTATYSNKNEVPVDFSYKMSLNDGYAWEMMSNKKSTVNSASAKLTYNGKNLIKFNSGSTADIDALISDDELTQYRGTANGLIQLMDNFIIVADMDLATEAKDNITLENTLTQPTDYNSPTYMTDLNNYRLKSSAGKVDNFNKNMKLILVSKKDGTKIADLVQRSEKEDNGNSDYHYYNSVIYLKFSDKTEVEMGAYFSTGFEKFETKFEDFIKSFEK